ncbi:MAG: WD40 repeat domain-containing protein [Pseudomonadota bacterium]
MNLAGRWRDARPIFDPAHAPFIEEMERNNSGITFAIILGPDEFLIRKGSFYQNGQVYHIRGDQAVERPELQAFAISRNRKYVALLDSRGTITIRLGLQGDAVSSLSWPPSDFFRPEGLPDEIAQSWDVSGLALRLETLAVSDDGRRLLAVNGQGGIFVARSEGGRPSLELLYPSVDPKYGLVEFATEVLKDDRNETFFPSLDMLHAALSPCGRYVGLGTQDYGHFIVDLDAPGGASVISELGYLSEYPHNACFSDDSVWVAFNSCHFYCGMTIAARVAKARGQTTEPYEESPLAPAIDSYLRVYASTWTPAGLGGAHKGAFLLAGGAVATAVTPKGKVLWELIFGSSAGSVDVCPISRRILIGSYSGMLHMLDPDSVEAPDRAIGWNAPKELKRWIFWRTRKGPIQW